MTIVDCRMLQVTLAPLSSLPVVCPCPASSCTGTAILRHCLMRGHVALSGRKDGTRRESSPQQSATSACTCAWARFRVRASSLAPLPSPSLRPATHTPIYRSSPSSHHGRSAPQLSRSERPLLTLFAFCSPAGQLHQRRSSKSCPPSRSRVIVPVEALTGLLTPLPAFLDSSPRRATRLTLTPRSLPMVTASSNSSSSRLLARTVATTVRSRFLRPPPSPPSCRFIA